MSENPTSDLVQRVRRGERAAEEDLFRRYEGHLIRLVQAKMSDRFARNFDPEDVVQSAYKSLFGAIRSDRYVDLPKGELWKVLAEIARHKLFRRIERCRRRDEIAVVTELPADFEPLDAQPSPEEVTSVVERFEECLRDLDDAAREVVRLTWLEGRAVPEVAASVNRAERTVRRWRDTFRERLLAKFLEQ